VVFVIADGFADAIGRRRQRGHEVLEIQNPPPVRAPPRFRSPPIDRPL
jgi:hypothetical protein